VKRNLPARPHLDHLKAQAKALSSALKAQDPDAVSTIQQYLPAARGLDPAGVAKMHLRLADAQSAIARKYGFESWAQLSRHVEHLRAMEGTWAFAQLEVDGKTFPAAALRMSRLLIDGDGFRADSPEASGTFAINVEADPHEIDLHFLTGPEAGNVNHGIFRFDGDTLQICLDMHGKPRPAVFGTTAGSGHAFEVLTRLPVTVPADAAAKTETEPRPPANIIEDFAPVESVALARLQGQWTAVEIIKDSQPIPDVMLRTVTRLAQKNEVTIAFGRSVMIRALVKLDDSADPIAVDYYHLAGAAAGQVQYGILKWDGSDACFCMAAAGDPRPADFACPPGSRRTYSQWRPQR
jgi:uncharacterized protein (TIGR03067 family)